MCEIDNKILERFSTLEIDCPECEDLYPNDDQYTCTTCYCEGGQGAISLFYYLREYPELLKLK